MYLNSTLFIYSDHGARCSVETLLFNSINVDKKETDEETCAHNQTKKVQAIASERLASMLEFAFM